jgi:hypothetical protein
MTESQRQREASVEDTAEYLADLIGQLRRLASKSGFETVAYALEVARLAALEETSARGDPDFPRPSPQLHS